MIIPYKELHDIRTEHRDESISLRFGCYDLLHAGHQNGIEFAKSQADFLVVGVMPDAYVRKVKGPSRPINTEMVRTEAIDQAEGVDYSVTVPPDALALAGLFLRLKPDVYVEDEEYGAGKLKNMFLRTIGTKYVIDRQDKTMSTSNMIASLGLAEAISKSSLMYVHGNSQTA